MGWNSQSIDRKEVKSAERATTLIQNALAANSLESSFAKCLCCKVES
jgi:hypothetical protein